MECLQLRHEFSTCISVGWENLGSGKNQFVESQTASFCAAFLQFRRNSWMPGQNAFVLVLFGKLPPFSALRHPRFLEEVSGSGLHYALARFAIDAAKSW